MQLSIDKIYFLNFATTDVIWILEPNASLGEWTNCSPIKAIKTRKSNKLIKSTRYNIALRKPISIEF